MNLLRLADSPLLLDGFDDFVRIFLRDPEPCIDFQPRPNEIEWLGVLPSEVRQYWEIAKRWPQANLGLANVDFEFGVSDEFSATDPQVEIINGHTEDLSVFWHQNDKQLGTDSSMLDITPAQMLVTFGLDALNSTYVGENEIPVDNYEPFGISDADIPYQVFTEAKPLWNGKYDYRSPRPTVTWNYMDSPQVLWYSNPENDWNLFASHDFPTHEAILDHLEASK